MVFVGFCTNSMASISLYKMAEDRCPLHYDWGAFGCATVRGLGHGVASDSFIQIVNCKV